VRWGAVLFACVAWAQGAESVLVVVNQSSLVSRQIGEYYVRHRSVPLANVCNIKVTANEEISRDIYTQQIEAPIAAYLKSHGLEREILYIVTTLGVPLKVLVPGSSDIASESFAVDSELTLLYGKMLGAKFGSAGFTPNPFFGKKDARFEHPLFPIYLVTRLAGYDFADVKGMIDHSMLATDHGKFVIDLKSNGDANGDNWLRAAAAQLPKDRVVLDESDHVVYDQRDVIGYAGWGSNDSHRKRRLLGFQWLPGAIATEFVSTNGRTFLKPPNDWAITTWKDSPHWFAGSPQTLTADYIHEGVTGCSGHVYEPFLQGTPRPDLLLPAYCNGRNLAESYYLAIPGLSWQNIVVGDPLCRLRR
jgi:uncharacterized protein (TIGR03790 family)